ncbi:MAG: phosphoethanolamine transferase, partial [Prevotellaceae bacterium]|nr:phosphoethanolamine transferase [Prevotellaceae bacterium]
IYRFKKIKKIAYLPFHIVFALAWFYLIFQLPRIERPMTERIPMNLYFIPAQYFEEKKEILKHRAEFEGQVFCSENKPIVVLIIGETLRADHLGLNGYERNTTPMLEKEDVISFQNIYSEETNTSPSVAHILTRADSIHPELAYSERSFVDLFKKCGYYTMWLANQEPAGAYIYFMQECDTLIYGQINKSYYSWDKWTDELLLPPFDSITQSTDESRLIIMHTIGSHWYYNTHFTADFQRFNPITKSRITSSNTSEEMINSYDNTVLFTDYFIVQVISRLKNKNAVVFYLSDHGEALGENGVWLHANNVEGAHKPACMVWLSEKYKADNTQRYKTLKQNAQKHYRTDFVFHTILESANIESEVINKEMSLFY